MIFYCRFSAVLLVMVAAGMFASRVSAQPSSDAAKLKFTNGFEVGVDSVATLQEMQQQENLYVMEVTFKSMRMRWVDVTDAKTGKKSRELVWYLVYKAVNRPLPKRQDNSDIAPKNEEDPVPLPLFIPELTLVTNDNGKQQIYHDTIYPIGQADILRRESRYKGQPTLKNSVQATGPVPPPSPEPKPQQAGTPMKVVPEKAVYGVAIFRNVDPDTDFFTVYMSGFSNGYRKENGMTLRKTIVQKYLRPGDRFFQTESEIKRDGDPKWMYWPDDTPGKISAAKQP